MTYPSHHHTARPVCPLRLLQTFAPLEAKIARYSIMGLSPDEIAVLTGQTIGRILAKLQQLHACGLTDAPPDHRP